MFSKLFPWILVVTIIGTIAYQQEVISKQKVKVETLSTKVENLQTAMDAQNLLVRTYGDSAKVLKKQAVQITEDTARKDVVMAKPGLVTIKLQKAQALFSSNLECLTGGVCED